MPLLTTILQPCHLLNLSCDLRDRIWKEASHEPDDIVMDSDVPRCIPLWMSATRQICREAIPIWMLSNRFAAKIHDRDHLKSLVINEHCFGSFVDTERVDVRVTLQKDNGFPPDFGMLWAKFIHERNNWRPMMSDSEDFHGAITASTLQMAHLCRGMPWGDCKKVLRASHAGMTKALGVTMDS